MKVILILSLIGLALFVVVMVVLNINQERLIFRPERLPQNYQFQFATPFEERQFQVKPGITLSALHFRAPNSKGLVFYLHGNAGSLRSWGEVASEYTRFGYDVLIPDYRGYGKSSGRISNEQMLHRDARWIYEKALEEYSSSNIVVVGRSLGSGIAAQLAAKFACQLLILETPYFNFRDLVDHHYWFLPTGWILKYRFRTNQQLKKVSVPVYLFHGTEDELIPFNSSERLEALGEHIELITMHGARHSEYRNNPNYRDGMERIFKSLETASAD